MVKKQNEVEKKSKSWNCRSKCIRWKKWNCGKNSEEKIMRWLVKNENVAYLRKIGCVCKVRRWIDRCSYALTITNNATNEPVSRNRDIRRLPLKLWGCRWFFKTLFFKIRILMLSTKPIESLHPSVVAVMSELFNLKIITTSKKQ